MSKIITISRQFGSGGREVGKRLADALLWSYFDRELIEQVATETGLDKGYIEKYSESVATRNHPYVFGRTFIAYQQSPSEKIQLAQLKIIRELAEKGDCVIIGRCADYITREQNPFKVFIYSSSMDFRIDRCYDKVPADRENKTEKEMQKEIIGIDKRRRKYYEYYTGLGWGAIENYNLCIDTSAVGIQGAVEIIQKAVGK